MTVRNSVGVVDKNTSDGSAIPVISTTDHRMGMAAFLRRDGGTARARTGKLKGGPSANLNVLGTAGWAYQVQPGVLVLSVSDTGGAYVVPNDGVVQVATDPSPSTGSRVDRIYMGQADAFDANTGTTTQPILGVARGAVATTGTPADPAIPAGTVEIARNVMAASATNTLSSGNNITTMNEWTTASGGVNYYATTGIRDADQSREIGDICYVHSTQRPYLRKPNGAESQIVLTEDLPPAVTVKGRSTIGYADNGVTVTDGVTRTAASATVTVPAGSRGILSVWFGIHIGASTTNGWAGVLVITVDGTNIRLIRYGNHGRSGFSQFTIVEPGYSLAPGTHTIQTQVQTNGGSAAVELWDGETTISVMY